MPAIMILGFDLEITRVHAGRGARRIARHPDDDPAAPRADRAAARRAQVSGRHRLRRGAEGGRVRRIAARLHRLGRQKRRRRRSWAAQPERGDHLHRVRHRPRLQDADGALQGVEGHPEKIFGAPLKAGSMSAEISPELLGVGYIIGPRIASIMCAGGVLAYLVLIPADQVLRRRPAARATRAGHGADRRHGAGRDPRRLRALHRRGRRGRGRHHQPAALAADDLARARGTGLRDTRRLRSELRRRCAAHRARPVDEVRADRHASRSSRAITLAPQLHMNLLGALLIVVFGFLFVTVSSRLTGEIGSSSNPISGMTVATLLLTCLVFLVLGWTGPGYYVTALVGGRHRLHRRVQRRHHLAGSQDRIPGRRDAAAAADRHPDRRAGVGRGCSGRSCSSSTTAAPSTCRWRKDRARASAHATASSSRSGEALQRPAGRAPTPELPRLAQARRDRRAARQVPGG